MIRPHLSSSRLRRRAGLCFLLACTAPWRAQADFSLSLAVPTARWAEAAEGQLTSVMAPAMGRNPAYRATVQVGGGIGNDPSAIYAGDRHLHRASRAGYVLPRGVA